MQHALAVTTTLLTLGLSLGCGTTESTPNGTGNSGTGNSGTGAAGNTGTGATGNTGTGATGNTGTGATGNVGTGGTGNTGGAAGGSGGAGGGAGGGPVAPPQSPVRFIAMGDGGEGNMTQFKVADAVQQVCQAAGGCDFALYLGDNIYNTGVDSASDNQFQTKFEQPYANLSFPFYITLGNHDYGGGGAGFEFFKGQYQIDYSASSTKWTLPDHYYTFDTQGAQAGVSFFSLDTNSIMYTGASTQQQWLQNAIAASNANWKIAFGHHTYISNGQHGNAGNYEGIPPLPIVSGGNVKDFVEDAVCGDIDIYFCGHDHNRQWLMPTCGTEFIVSGTAAKTTDLVGQGTPTFFETDQKGGFMLAEIVGNTFTGTFYDEDATLEYTRSFTKP